MAQLTGTPEVFHSDTTTTDSSQVGELGRRAWDANGNEYVYLTGTASTVAGDWVTYDKNSYTSRLVPDAVGPVAIAMAATTAGKYGWYQRFGKNTIARTDSVAANTSLYIDDTAGRVDDLGVAGDLVVGATSLTADTSNVASVYINYPHVTNDLGQSGTATPGGSNTFVQFNDSSTFGGDADLTFNKNTGTLRAVGYIVGTAHAVPDTNDGAQLGTTAFQFSDLFLASGAVIDFNNANAVLTHSAGVVTVSTGDLRVTTAGTNTASAATLGGTQTLTNKSVALGSNTLTGTTAQFNTALTDNDFATLAGSETLTNKSLTSPTITSPTITGTGAGTLQSLQVIGVTTIATALNTVLIATSGTIGTATTTQIQAVVGTATTTVGGIVSELATSAETTTGSDTSRVITPNGLSQSDYGVRIVQLKLFDDSTAASTGSNKVVWWVPAELNNYRLVDADAFVSSTSEALISGIQVRNVGSPGTYMHSTFISIDANEFDSTTAATAPVISATGSAVNTGNRIAIDIQTIGTAKGLGVNLEFAIR